MNTEQTFLNSESETLEETAADNLRNLQRVARARLLEGEAFVQNEPVKAMAIAMSAGYLLHILPLGAILRGLVGLACAVFRPAVILYGAMKMLTLFGRRCDSHCDRPLQRD